MAAYVKFNTFVGDLGEEVHNLVAAGDTLRIFLTNSTPNVATHTVRADLTEITAGNGYTAGGEDVQNDYSQTGGTATLTGTSITWTASGGSFGPFRYAVMYNDTAANDPLICYWDYGSSISVTDPETFQVVIGSSLFTLT